MGEELKEIKEELLILSQDINKIKKENEIRNNIIIFVFSFALTIIFMMIIWFFFYAQYLI